MREIKFRVWDLTNRMFRYYDYDSGFDNYKFWDIINDIEHERPSQYTGLKDKNSKEIYEGDICHATKPNCYIEGDYIVVWDIKKGGWAYKYLEEDFLSKHQVGCSGNLRCEVIGNIFENPELLNTKE